MNTNTLPQTIRFRSPEAAAYCGYVDQTFRSMRHFKTGPRSYKIGGKVWYDKDDLDAWIAAQKARTAVGGIA